MTQANTTQRKPMKIAVNRNGSRVAALLAEYATAGRIADAEAAIARVEAGEVMTSVITPKPFAVAHTDEDECARWYASQKTA